MRWFVIALLITLPPVFAAYSGTFRDDFSDSDLDGWRVSGFPKPVSRIV